MRQYRQTSSDRRDVHDTAAEEERISRGLAPRRVMQPEGEEHFYMNERQDIEDKHALVVGRKCGTW